MAKLNRKVVPSIAPREGERVLLAGRIVEITARGLARFVGDDGAEIICRCAQHVSVAWLRAAVVLEAVEAEIAATSDRRTGSVWSLFPSPAHEGVAADTVELRASATLRLTCGESTLTLTKEGKSRLRAREVSVRGSRIARVSGGVVKIN